MWMNSKKNSLYSVYSVRMEACSLQVLSYRSTVIIIYYLVPSNVPPNRMPARGIRVNLFTRSKIPLKQITSFSIYHHTWTSNQLYWLCSVWYMLILAVIYISQSPRRSDNIAFYLYTSALHEWIILPCYVNRLSEILLVIVHHILCCFSIRDEEIAQCITFVIYSIMVHMCIVIIMLDWIWAR